MKHKPRDSAQKTCSVDGCNEDSRKTLSAKKVESACPDLKLTGKVGNRAHLCKKHYKEFKKKTRKEREFERLGWER